MRQLSSKCIQKTKMNLQSKINICHKARIVICYRWNLGSEYLGVFWMLEGFHNKILNENAKQTKELPCWKHIDCFFLH